MPNKIDLSSIKKKNTKPIEIIDKKPDLKPKITPVPKFVHQKDQIKIYEPPKQIKQTKPKKPKMEIVALSENERAKKVKLLELYCMEFPDELAQYKNKNWNKCSDNELIEYKKIFDKSVTSSNSLNWAVTGSQQALRIYEMLGNLAGLQIQGISELGKQEEWVKNIKAICLKYMDGGIKFVEPEHQILFLLVQQTLTLHYINTSPKLPQLNEESNIINNKTSELQEINQQYNDL
jgi:hypothetical protein